MTFAQRIWDLGYNQAAVPIRECEKIEEKWNDNYDILPPSAIHEDGDEYFLWNTFDDSTKWVESNNCTKNSSVYVCRRLKPGLVKAQVKE